jgi:hypothetical protein
MKKIFLIVWVVALSSCSKDIVNLNDPQNFNEGNYYSNANENLEAVAAIYSNLVAPGMDRYFYHATDALAQEMSLLTATEPTQIQFNNYNVDANNPVNASIWHALFRQIWRASFALEKVEAWQPALDDERKQKQYMMGECKFFRAWTYYYLTMLYGDVPMHLSATDIKNNPAKPLSPVTEIEATIIEPELLSAIELLPSKWEAKYQGRITKGAAQTYLAKYYIGAGKFPEAITQLNNVINDGAAGYTYSNDFYVLFSLIVLS